jgi:autotransporter-associated beta strand protein
MKRLLLVIVSVFLITQLKAVQKTWGNTGTDFNTTGNWTGGTPSAGDVAFFSTAASQQPNLSASLSIAGLFFSGTSSSGYNLTATNSAILTLTGYNTSGSSGTSNSSAAAIRSEITSGTNTFNVPLTLAPASGTTSTFFQAAGGTLAVNGLISGSGITLGLAGTGTIQLTGTNTYSGGTSVGGAATVVIGNDSALGSGTLTNNAAATYQAGSGARSIANTVVWATDGTISGANDLTINGSFTSSGSTNRAITVNNSGTTTFSGSVYLAGSDVAGGLTVNGSGALVISGSITNNSGANTVASALTLNSTGTLTLSGTNTYTGATSLTAGTLILGNKAAFGTGTVAWNGVSSSTSADLSGANAIANTSTITGNPTFTGTNNLELSGSVTDTGTRTVTNNISGGLLTFSGAVNLSSNASNFTMTLAGTGNTLISGNIGNGSGGSTASKLTYSGGGTLTLTGTNTYGGVTTINSGMVQFGKEVSLYNNVTGSWTAANLVIASGATAAFNVGGTGEFTSSDIATLAALGNTTAGFKSGSILGLDTTNAAGGTFTHSTAIANPNSGTNTLGLTKLGTGTLVLTGANSYTGNTTISAGTLQIGNGSTTGTLGSGGVTNNAALAFDRSNDLTVANVIGGTGTLTQAGAGNVTLSGVNTYSGGTTISAGTLTAGHDSAFGTGTINIGGTLDIGSHTIANSLVLSSGTVSGNSGSLGGTISGTGTLTGPLTLTASAIYQWNIGETLTVSGGTAALTLDSSFTLNLSSLTTSSFTTGSNHSWTVIATSGVGTTIVGTAPSINGVDGSFTGLGSFNTTLTGSALALNWTTAAAEVPEPSAYAAIFGAVALAAAVWHRRKSA